MRILSIESNRNVALALEAVMKDENHSFTHVDTGEEGIEVGGMFDYDVILLDLNLADMSGFDVIRTLRLEKVRTPIIALSEQGDVDATIKALNFGADDFVAKPYHPGELLARISAVVRRSKGLSESVITTGNLSVNLDTKEASVDGTPVYLTTKEYAIIELLSLRKGATLSKEVFLDHLYGGMDEPEIKIVDVFICKLRKKLTKAKAQDGLIETVWGRGYLLREPQQGEAAKAA